MLVNLILSTNNKNFKINLGLLKGMIEHLQFTSKNVIKMYCSDSQVDKMPNTHYRGGSRGRVQGVHTPLR